MSGTSATQQELTQRPLSLVLLSMVVAGYGGVGAILSADHGAHLLVVIHVIVMLLGAGFFALLMLGVSVRE